MHLLSKIRSEYSSINKYLCNIIYFQCNSFQPQRHDCKVSITNTNKISFSFIITCTVLLLFNVCSSNSDESPKTMGELFNSLRIQSVHIAVPE